MFGTKHSTQLNNLHNKRKMDIQFDATYFCDKDTLECGQVFRFNKYDGRYTVCSGDKACRISTVGDITTITCEENDKDYFYNYFDLATDYSLINARAQNSGFAVLEKAAKMGAGVRILKQNSTEMLFSFLISQNNNIPRIKGIIEKLCTNLGEKKQAVGVDYYAFPSLAALKNADLAFYKSIGLGYRAEFFKDLADLVDDEFILRLASYDGTELKKQLLKIRGIGDKVADCVRLFGFYKTDSFPVDVWIEKLYAEDFCGKEKNREKISAYFVNTFGSDSGYFQQYLFHYKRNLEKQT